MTAVLNEHFSIVYDICRAACHGDTALGRSSVKKLAALIESSTPDDAALLKRLTKKAAKNPAHFVQSDEGGSKPTPSVEHDERGAFEAEWKRSGWGDADTKNQCFHFWQARAASTSANVAQGAEAVGLVMTNDKGEKYGALLDSNIEERTKLYAAPPAQTALTDEQAENIARRLLAEAYEERIGEGPYPSYAKVACGGQGSFTLCSIRAIKRALTAAQSGEPK